MRVHLLVVIIGLLATSATGCVSQQDKETIAQWQEFKEHLWAKQSPATSEPTADEQALETPEQSEQGVEDVQPAAEQHSDEAEAVPAEADAQDAKAQDAKAQEAKAEEAEKVEEKKED